MDMNWLNIAAGVITVITGLITIANAMKRKKSDDPVPKSQPTQDNTVVVKPSVQPIKPIDGVYEFLNNEKGYEDWMRQHPNGFVVNTYAKTDPNYMVLHTASCGRHITNYATRKPGAFTENGFKKICATDVDALQKWPKAHGGADGTFSSRCSCTARAN